jgi:hypothetical protein
MQKEETVIHLFLRCNFARRCWQTIGVTTPRSSGIHNQIDFATVGQKVESGDNNSHDVVHMEMHKRMDI